MKVDGACHCGHISFEAEIGPEAVRLCHCIDCQILTGSAYQITVSARAQTFHLRTGEPSIYIKAGESGNKRAHAFCPRCGTPIYSTAPNEPDSYGIRVARSSNAPCSHASLAARSCSQGCSGCIGEQFGGDLMPGVSISANTFESVRNSVFSSWRAAVWLLGTVCVVAMVVTAIGAMGLTSYWVQQRTRLVGIRRALGARRRDILHYFLAANMLIVGIGVLLGMLSAFSINLYLVHHYELARLPWIYLPVGAVALWLLGQLAVLSPALLAVPPAVATRGV